MLFTSSTVSSRTSIWTSVSLGRPHDGVEDAAHLVIRDHQPSSVRLASIWETACP
jgi:hypothetical protein